MKINKNLEKSSFKKSIEEIYFGGSRARDPFIEERAHFRRVLVSSVIFFLIFSALIFWGFQKYQNYQDFQKKEVSNSILSASFEKREETQKEKKEEENIIEEEKVQTKNPSEIKIVALNGGAAKGSAGKVQAILKSQGYAQAEAKNAVSDYAGVTIFYLAEMKAEALELKEKIKNDFPQIKEKEAVSQEEKMAEIVIILGR